MRFLAPLSLLCLLLALPAFAQTDEAIAQQFYPEALRADLQLFSDEDLPPIVQFVRGDLTGAGSKLLVVAYSNGRKGALRVIDVSGAPTLLDENFDLLGTNPSVELFDLDHDGRNEIIATFQGMRTDKTSLFKWSNAHLQLWGPTSVDQYGVERSILPTLDYVDLDGDGILELIVARQPDFGIMTETVYHLSGGKYVESRPAAFHAEYVREEGAPQTERTRFPGGTGQWVLRVVNGDNTGARTVTAGEIRLNGVAVVTTDKLKQKVRTISVPVTLSGDNTIEVELRSAPGTGLTVSVTKE